MAILDDILRDFINIGPETTQNTPKTPPKHVRQIPDPSQPTPVRQNLTKITIDPVRQIFEKNTSLGNTKNTKSRGNLAQL